MTDNRTSQSCYTLMELCTDKNCDISPSLYADFPAIAEKYKRMEEALVNARRYARFYDSYCKTIENADAKIQEALSFDPLSK